MRRVIALAALFASGCAAGPRPAPGTSMQQFLARDDVRAKYEELLALEQRVAAAIDPEAHCEETLCPSSARICELADSICGIAARHAADLELAERCTDGTQRCDRARARVAARCECP